MQEVVVSAVRKAVSAATIIFATSSTMLFFFIKVKCELIRVEHKLWLAKLLSVNHFVETEASCKLRFIKQHPTFLPCHSTDEQRPVLFGETLPSSEARPKADVADVTLCGVLAGRCPTGNNFCNTVDSVPVGISTKQTEGSANAPFHGIELYKIFVCLFPALSHPDGTNNPPYVQRVVVSESSCHFYMSE